MIEFLSFISVAVIKYPANTKIREEEIYFTHGSRTSVRERLTAGAGNSPHLVPSREQRRRAPACLGLSSLFLLLNSQGPHAGDGNIHSGLDLPINKTIKIIPINMPTR